MALAWALGGLAPLGAQAAPLSAASSSSLTPSATLAQPASPGLTSSRAADAAAPVVWRAPWGSSPGKLGRTLPQEANPECPMTFTVDRQGRAWVLDQLNARVQVFDRTGKVERVVPLTVDTFQDLVLADGGKLALLDRLVTQSVAFVNEKGAIEREVPLVGTGVTHGGGVTALFRHADGYWVEFDHTHLVRVATPDGRPDTQRPLRPGRLSADGRTTYTAQLERPLHVRITQQGTAPGSKPAPFARVQFRLPVSTLLALEPDQKGNVLLAAHTLRESDVEPFAVVEQTMALVVLDRRGREVRRAELPILAGPEEQLRPFRLGDDGALYQLACEEQGAVLRRFVP